MKWRHLMKSYDESKVSRRRFLEAAVVVTATAKTVRADEASTRPDRERERLEALIETFGSELGDLRKVD
jgi:hypothetical protein